MSKKINITRRKMMRCREVVYRGPTTYSQASIQWIEMMDEF